jgi:uncharacterized protein YutE (UPF0331/DUF86 family)
MNKEEIIQMAIEHTISSLKFDEDGLERFAKLIAQHERDACAKIADNFAMTSQYKTQRSLAEWCASSIRARGQA